MSNEFEPVYYALNVSLFAFTLQSGSYLDSQELINESPHNFKHKYEKLLKDNFSSKLDFSKPFPELREDFPRSDNYDLLDSPKKGKRQYFLRSSQETNQNPIQPKPLYRLLVYPQKLSDSYALLINFYRPQAEGFDSVKLSEVGEFNPNKCLTLKKDPHFIGETLLITAFLSQSKPNKAEELRTNAEDLLKQLLGSCPDFYQADNFLDSYILEFSQPKILQTRYLVLFYFAESTPKQLQEIYWDLPELFLYYHKITKVFQQSRKYADELDKLIREEIESKSKLPESLDLEVLKNRLKDILKTVPTYTLKVRNLEDTLNTINIHIRNYELILKRLQVEVSNSLDLFSRFAERESQTFQLQIQADLNYAKPGSQLLDQAISSIRGLVEIDQAESDRASELREKERDRQLQQTLQANEIKEKERDRELENTIQAVGTGIGVGIGFAGILASSYPLIEKPWDFPSPQHPLLAPHPFIIAITISCLFGGGLGWLAWLLITRKMLRSSSSTNQIRGSVQTSLSSSQTPEVAIPQQPEEVRSQPLN
ncbi:hypothetical protein PN499_21385 [Kamptonema animale CS-326]|jgi:hypothetical protein|uniref:hypothetical protein n=1 Tax=Kamptonema animale TaxID=92934 RepID=UPI00232F8DCB|nr:hypothetical protein [Kamptonema animale]MDB9513754.1 hypothetical protein [Kamptonema animale CS-326]